MANIDVSDLMVDPDFVNKFEIVRRLAAINDFGEAVFTESSFPIIGSVQAGDGATLKRLPEGAQLEDTKTIYSKTQLRANVPGGYSDIVIWKCKRYQVLTVMPWENWGAGWYRCDCVMEKASL